MIVGGVVGEFSVLEFFRRECKELEDIDNIFRFLGGGGFVNIIFFKEVLREIFMKIIVGNKSVEKVDGRDILVGIDGDGEGGGFIVLEKSFGVVLRELKIGSKIIGLKFMGSKVINVGLDI